MISASLGEGDRVFMVAMHSSLEDRVRQHRAFVDAAVAAGVGRLVYLSCLGAGPDVIFLHGRSHGETEQMVRDSGIPFTFVRMSMWADDIPNWFDEDGVIRAPHGDGRISFTYRPEIALVIAATLTGDGHEGETYDVTGPQSITMSELAATATAVTGQTYGCEPQGREEWKESGWRWDARPGQWTPGSPPGTRSTPTSSTSFPTSFNASPAPHRSPSRNGSPTTPSNAAHRQALSAATSCGNPLGRKLLDDLDTDYGRK